MGVSRTPAGKWLQRLAVSATALAISASQGQAMAETAAASTDAPGRLIVRERGGRAIHVLVDGVDQGPAPWTGEVAAGAHTVAGSGVELEVEPQRVEVQAGGTAVLILDAVNPAAQVDLQTRDHLGQIVIDGRVMGQGQYRGELAAGEHVLVITRAGYYDHQETLSLAHKQVVVETIGLTPLPPREARAARALEGFYAGFGVAMLVEPGGAGNELQTRCPELGATSCSTQSPIGGALFAHFGYTWDPVGLELFLAAEYDQSSPQASYDGQPAPNENPFVAQPARKEAFTFYRAGGVAALRVRATVQSARLRASVAVGAGVAYKTMFMSRTTTSTDASHLQDSYVPPAVEYVSPAVVGDASFQLRVGPTTAISLGALAWVENAGGDARTKPDAQRCFASCQLGAASVPLPTPGYQAASSTQVFVGPYVGIQLGP